MYFEEDEQYEEDLGANDSYDSGKEAPTGSSKNVLMDIELLKASENNVPDTAREKDLRACLKCKLILSES